MQNILIGTGLFLTFATITLTLVIVDLIKVRRFVSATIEWWQKADEFRTWRTRNPGVYIGLSSVGQHLVRELISTYDHWVRLHSHHEEDGTRAYLVALLNELPEPPPKEFRPPKTRTFVRVFPIQ